MALGAHRARRACVCLCVRARAGMTVYVMIARRCRLVPGAVASFILVLIASRQDRLAREYAGSKCYCWSGFIIISLFITTMTTVVIVSKEGECVAIS